MRPVPMLLRSLPALVAILPALTSAGAEPELSAADLPRVPPQSPEQALAGFKIRPGFRIEAAAVEPAVLDPVAMAFDENSVLYAVEMRDYSERRSERLSTVRRLEDRDGDGRFETSTVFMDGLAWATGIACANGGVFIAASPDIWFAKDTTGDGVADERRVVFTGFGEGKQKLNVQALLNSLTYGPDHRIWGAAAGNGGRIHKVAAGRPEGPAITVDGADFSFDPVTLDFRAESGTAQFGLTFDEFGERYVCSNSAHIQWVAWSRADAGSSRPWPMPPALVNIPVDGPAAEVFRISPEEPWRVVRTRWRASGLVPGLIEGGGRSSGYFTSASGVHIAGGAVARGCAFIGDVGSNLVHRKVISWTPDGPVAKRAADEASSEFLASPDNWFRPVAFATGPDGGLYIADMYREFIEHPDSLPPTIKRHMDLNSGNDRGRIWRIVPDAFMRTPWPKLGALNDAQLASLPPVTSWHTATARRLLRERASALEPVSRPVPAEEQSGRDAIQAVRRLCRSGGEPSAIVNYFNLPASGNWEPGMAALLARHSLTSRDQAAAAFNLAASAGNPLASLRLASFLDTPLTDPLLSLARNSLTGTKEPETLRMAAVAALKNGHPDELRAVALSGTQSGPVRAEALRAVPAAARDLLESWSAQPTALRTTALELMMASARGAILDAVAGGKLPATELPAHFASQLRQDSALKSRAQAILPPPPADRQAVVAARQGALKLIGNGDRGRTLFLQVCATCHRDGSDGAAVGPDRTGFRNLGKPTLLLNLLDPNREVAPRYFTVIATTTTGESWAGVLTEETPDSIRILMPGGIEKILIRQSIAKLERSSRSLMPEGIEAAWNDQDLADLLAFLVR